MDPSLYELIRRCRIRIDILDSIVGNKPLDEEQVNKAVRDLESLLRKLKDMVGPGFESVP